jgi:hypothetical protein
VTICLYGVWVGLSVVVCALDARELVQERLEAGSVATPAAELQQPTCHTQQAAVFVHRQGPRAVPRRPLGLYVIRTVSACRVLHGPPCLSVPSV